MSGNSAESGVGPFDPYWLEDERGSAPRRRDWRVRATFGLVAAGALIVAAVLVSGRSEAPRAAAPAAVVAPAGETVDASLEPLIVFGADDGAQVRYEARVDRASGARRDVLSLGELSSEAAALRLEAWEDASARPGESLFVEMAEEAARFDAVVVRLGETRTLATPKGPAEWANLTLAAGAAPRRCVGFRVFVRADRGLRGFACAGAGAAFDEATLGCLLDRLTPTRAGRAAGFADIGKGAGARRSACGFSLG